YLPFHKFFLVSWHLLNLFFLLSPSLFFVDPVFLSLFFIKIITDIIVVFNLQKSFGYAFNPLKTFYLQIMYELFLIINFFNALLEKTDWKK
ncbi:MAG TPA: hypothetical protein VLN45_04920, partial [Ignavibacteriaceae bacterium]|nr:hypothetical protein [Ignavibacteriaceae bacterium]